MSMQSQLNWPLLRGASHELHTTSKVASIRISQCPESTSEKADLAIYNSFFVCVKRMLMSVAIIFSNEMYFNAD